MHILRYSLIGLFLMMSSFAAAGPLNLESEIDQNRLLTTDYNIILFSPFSDSDHVTAYTYGGVFLWDIPTPSKILSWKLVDGYLYILSKDRYREITYLTCFNSLTGQKIWERP